MWHRYHIISSFRSTKLPTATGQLHSVYYVDPWHEDIKLHLVHNNTACTLGWSQASLMYGEGDNDDNDAEVSLLESRHYRSVKKQRFQTLFILINCRQSALMWHDISYSNTQWLSSSSHMRIMNHNWSATKQRLHPQSVAEISRHSVLSGDRIRQCGTSSGSRHKDTDQCP